MDATGFPRMLSALLLGLALAQPALAQQAPPAPSPAAGSIEAMSARYPRGAITSDDLAEQAQIDVQSVRAALAEQLAGAKNACYDRFFTNSCIDNAQEAYRAALEVLRPIELEAGAFQRQSRVAKRDKALEERCRQEEAEAPDRLRIAQENEQKTAQKNQARAQEEAERQARAAERTANPDDRVQRHEEKIKRLREEDARKEQERARNIAAYEEKQRKAAERQKKVAERKAEKQAKQAVESKQSK